MAWRSLRRPWLVFAVVWAIVCIPLLVCTIPPLVDYPSHLARCYLLAHWNDLDPGYAEFYRPNWAILPNLAVEAVLIPLCKFLPPHVAGRVFLALLFGLTLSGAARLNRALTGSWNFWALAAALLIFNRILAFGFLNYLFGLGLALWALAIHIELRDRSPWLRLLIGMGFAVALFFCHLMATVIYGIVIVFYEVGRVTIAKNDPSSAPANEGRSTDLLRNWAVALIPLIAVAILYVAVSPTREEATSMSFDPWHTRLPRLTGVLLTGQKRHDYAFTGIVGVCVLLLIASGRLRLDRRMAWPVAGLFLAFLLSPHSLTYVTNLDVRLPIALLLFALPGMVWFNRDGFKGSQVVGAVGAALLVGAFGYRITMQTQHYSRSSAELETVVEDLRAVPPGSLLFTARDTNSQAFVTHTWHPPLVHAASLLLLDRPIYDSYMFANPTQQPFARQPKYEGMTLKSDVGGRDVKTFEDLLTNLRSVTASTELPVYLFYLKDPGSNPESSLAVLVSADRYILYGLSLQTRQ